jgi:hypothetical protein
MNQWFITVHNNGYKSDSAVMMLQTAIVVKLILRKLSWEDIKLFKYDAIKFYIQESQARLSEEEKKFVFSAV